MSRMSNSSILCLLCIVSCASGKGLLILYQPKDISHECVFSLHLRYDLSFGMGMSDTTTLIFRTIHDIDYQCFIEIVTEDQYLVIVIRFPNTIHVNCAANRDAFAVHQNNSCVRICNSISQQDPKSSYFVIVARERIQFRFISNSSINADMKVNTYQVTATSARLTPPGGCNRINETVCIVHKKEYCFTSGVVCDGIKNCGVSNWFDERRSECELPTNRIGFAPVLTVAAIILFILLAASHLMTVYLPPLANSFFIFNANEDNRLCIDSVFGTHERTSDYTNYEKNSVHTVLSSSLETDDVNTGSATSPLRPISKVESLTSLTQAQTEAQTTCEPKKAPRKSTMRLLTEVLEERLFSFTRRRKQVDSIALDVL